MDLSQMCVGARTFIKNLAGVSTWVLVDASGKITEFASVKGASTPAKGASKGVVIIPLATPVYCV